MVRAWLDGGTEALRLLGPAADPPRVPATLARLEDNELAAMVAGGDRDGVAALHERYVGRVYDFVYRTLRNRAEAAAVTRAVMVDALTDLLLHPEPPHGVRGAFCSTARARVVERLGPAVLQRGETRPISDADSEQVGFDQLGSNWETAGDGAASAEAARNVWHNAVTLPLRHYIVLDLHLRQGLSGQALAESLDVGVPIAEHALVEAGRALLASSSPAPAPFAPLPSGETTDEGAAEAEGSSAGNVVWQMLGGYVDPAELERLDASPEARLLGALAPVPMPVELRNTIWRDLAARWPDPDEGPGDAPAARRAEGLAASPVLPLPASAPAESPAALTDTAPISASAAFGSRAGDQLLARTRGTTIRGDADLGSGGAFVVDENALGPVRSPIRLRPRGDRGLPLMVVMVFLLFGAGLLVGAFLRGPELVAAYLPSSISLPRPELPLLGSGGGTPTPPSSETPSDAAPSPTVPAGTPPAETPVPAAVVPDNTPTPVPTAVPAPPTETPSPIATQTATVTATATITATATVTPPPPPTDTPVPPPPPPPPPTNTPAPPPPTATPTRPPPTNTPRPPPPPPPPTNTPAPPPPPTDTPAPPTNTPAGRGILVPSQLTPRR